MSRAPMEQVGLASNPIFFFAIAQIVAILIYHVAQIADWGIDFEGAFKIGLPNTILMLGFAAPILVVGFVGRYARDVRALAAVVIAGLTLFAQNAQFIVEAGDYYYDNTVLWTLHHLLASSAIAASVFAAVEMMRGHRFDSLISPTSDWWRIPIGVLAGVVLMFEYPGRVLADEWRALSLLVVALLIFGALTIRTVRVGLFAGLGVGIAGSIVANALGWLLNSGDWYWWSFVSLPSLFALVCCAVIVAVDTVGIPGTQTQRNSHQQ